MAYPTIKIKKSSVAGKVPVSGDLDYGELAVNYNDGKLYYKNSSNVIKTFLDSANIVDLIDSAYVQARQSLVGGGTFDSADFNSMFAAKSTTNLSEGTNKYYTKARADSDDKYPTTFTYTAGTTAGPTGSLTGTNLTAISFAAIPSAGASASGIITTGAQTIAGAKTFSSTISGSIDGNAGTATTLATGRNFSLTGEVTAPAISFNGSGVVALATTIATDAVDSSNILALSVSSGKIQSGAITTAKFATGAVDSAAHGALSVSTAKIQGSAVTYAKMQNVATANRVLGSTTAGGAVSEVQIATGMIATGAVDSNALGALSVSSAKLQASIPDSKLATISTALKVSNSATTATDANTASAIVARDASGNFTAGTITATLSGSATTLATGRNFSLTGEVTAPAISFNGSGAVALATTIATDAVDSSNILALSISSGKIQTGAITTAKFANGAVDSNAIGLLSISTGDLKNNAVTYAKMQTVTTANRVLGSTTAAGAVSEVQIATGMIATGAVDSAALGALSVSSAKIQSGAISTAKFATGAVDSNALGALSVSSAKLQASIPDSKLATIATAGKVSNSATTATNLNTASAIVARDGSGNFSAGTITAALTGNASTATTLATARDINGVSFNGSANITVPSLYDTNYRRITNPGGAEYVTTTATVTGAIEIVLPVGYTNTMMRMTVKIFEYVSGESFTVECGGYNYLPTTTWTMPFAYITSSQGVDRRFSVRFGLNAAGKAVVYIGELASTWSYPQVYVTDVQLGYGGQSATWVSGWAINFQATAFENVTQTVTNPQIGYAVSTNTANSVVLRDASGNFTAGTITAALTGNASTATTLATSRNLWGQSFNGGAAVTGSLTSVGDITGTGAVTLTSTAGVLTLAATSNNNIVAKTNGSERMRIDSAGQVGIGTISPATKLDVAGVASAVSFENPQTITSNYTITTSRNAMNAGPITINAGVVVTVPSGSVWTIV